VRGAQPIGAGCVYRRRFDGAPCSTCLLRPTQRIARVLLCSRKWKRKWRMPGACQLVCRHRSGSTSPASWCFGGPPRADACNTCSDPLFLLSLSRNRNSSGFAKEHLPHVTYLEDVQVWAKIPAARPAAASTPYVTRRVTRSQTNSIPRRRVYVPSRPTHGQPHGTACPHTVASCAQRRRQRGCHVQVPLQDR